MKLKFKKDNKMKFYGDYNTKTKTIRINKRLNKKSGPGELIDTLFHETLHAKHPKLSERKVEARTTKGVKKLSKKAKQKLYSKFR